jgi:hypothetical protein
VTHDWTWERNLIDRLRRGERVSLAADLDDGPSEYPDNPCGWAAAEMHAKDAVRTSSAYLTDAQIAARAERRRLDRQSLREAMAENAAKVAKAKAERQAREAAKAEADRQWHEKYAEQTRRKIERDVEWERESRLARERNQILASRWACMECQVAGTIKPEGDGYALTCHKCGRVRHGSHETFVKLVATVRRITL